MPHGIRWVGLDVHARESTIAIFDQGTGELTTRRVVGRPHELLPWLRRVARPARMVYEAGPTGYGLARRARAEGIELGVSAPSKTERPPADRVKTDKRDAIRLARLLAAGELTLVTSRRSSASSCVIWCAAGRTFAWIRCARVTGSGSSCCPARSTGRGPVRRGRANIARGCAQRPVRAHGRAAAVPARDRQRFDHPDQLVAYLGIVPSEHTNGSHRRLGSITRAGSTHARRLLVEASYHYRRGPAVGEALERRQRGQAPEIINISWKAQRRLNARWRQLKHTRRKPGGIVAIAVTRELAAYCWEIATCPPHQDPAAPALPTDTPITRRRLSHSR
jgi:hypothetical protein